jgi:hypothetical protein
MTSPGYSSYEELEALTAPFWARLTAQGIERRRLEREHEAELSRWEGEGGLVREPEKTWRDVCLGLVREHGRRHGN